MLSLLRRCRVEEFNHNALKDRKLDEFRPKKPLAPIYQEEHEYEEEEEVSLFSRLKVLTPIILIAVICFASYAWYTDKISLGNHNNGELPVVKASKDPLREKPEDPGGMRIVNRDKMVYDAISGKDTDKNPKDAKILPEPEEPISHDDISKKAQTTEFINQLPAENTAEADGENNNDVEKPASTVDEPEKDVASSAAETKSVAESDTQASIPPAPAVKTTPVSEPVNAKPNLPEKEIIKPAAVAAVVEAEKKAQQPVEKIKEVTAADIKDVAPAKKSPEPVKKNKTEIGYRIQLGSYRSAGDAESSEKIIKKKFHDILNGLNVYIEKVDLGDKGIYHRLQLYGFKSEADARKACQKLTEKKQGCFFVGK